MKRSLVILSVTLVFAAILYWRSSPDKAANFTFNEAEPIGELVVENSDSLALGDVIDGQDDSPPIPLSSVEDQLQKPKLVGIDREIKNCLIDSAWTEQLRGEYSNLNSLIEELQGIHGRPNVDRIIWRAQDITLKDGEKRRIRFEEGLGDSNAGSILYWTRSDAEGLPLPIGLPPGLEDSTLDNFYRLAELGEVSSIEAGRVIEFNDQLEVNVLEKNGKVSEINIQSPQHEVHCFIDEIKGYGCECPF